MYMHAQWWTHRDTAGQGDVRLLRGIGKSAVAAGPHHRRPSYRLVAVDAPGITITVARSRQQQLSVFRSTTGRSGRRAHPAREQLSTSCSCHRSVEKALMRLSSCRVSTKVISFSGTGNC